MSVLVANRIRTPDGTIVQSFHRHDYKIHKDKNGFEYMVDGGLDYLRRAVNPDAPHEEISVWTDDPFEDIREAFHWGTRGKDGKQPLAWKPLKDLDTSHIEAILETQQQVPDHMVEIFKEELNWRKNEV